MTLAAALALGFALGLRHATDADHVVAVSTIVARTRRLGAAWLLGAAWGLGHSLTIFLVGTLIIVCKVAVSPRLGLALESAVGAALISLGLWNLSGRGQRPATVHSHGGEPPHVHGPELPWLRRQLRAAGPAQLLRSAAVGLVHGLAGSAAVALLVLAAIPQPRAALAYLLVFGAGTLCGMLLLSSLMELSFVRLAALWAPGQLWLARVTGALSLLLGVWIVWTNR